ncbi:MAG: tRNA lysidine(34) synthetase TilS [Pseudomonadaceae bacterium]|nr:tRNA lysidine(34) synthetase TilS [Pseudomonadaceae bacterium]
MKTPAKSTPTLPGRRVELVAALIDGVRQLIRTHPALDCFDETSALPRHGWRVLIGVSGGADSLALMLAAKDAFGAAAVQALHVDHGLQANSQASADRVAAICARHGIECLLFKVDVSRTGNLEQAARDARYRVFSDAMGESASILLLAHHAQDAAETVLMRLLRGRSAVGVPAVRRLAEGWLVRPLLGVDQQLLIDALAEAGEEPIEDPSNNDERFDRNWLRRSILPTLRQRLPQLDGILREQGARYRAAQELLAMLMSERAHKATQALALPPVAAATVLPLASLELAGIHEASAVRAWLHSVEIHEFSERQLQELCRQASAGASVGGLDGQDVILRLWRTRLYLEPKPCQFIDVQALWSPQPLPSTTNELVFEHGALSWIRAPAGPDPETQGDAIQGFQAMPAGAYSGRVRLPGRSGSRALGEVLAEANVPPWRRAGYPLILHDGELVEIAGISEACPADARAASVKFHSMWRPFVVGG